MVYREFKLFNFIKDLRSRCKISFVLHENLALRRQNEVIRRNIDKRELYSDL